MIEAQAAPAPALPEAQPAAEPQPGLLARVGNAVHGAYEVWQQYREQRRVIGEVALAIAGGTAATEAADLAMTTPATADSGAIVKPFESLNTEPAAIPWAIENHPYDGPGSASATAATASSATKECKTAALAFPTVVGKIPGTKYWGTIVSRAGLTGQSVGVYLETAGMPEACWPGSVKYGNASIWLSDKKHHLATSEMYNLNPSIHYGGNQAHKNQVVQRDQAGTRKDNCKPGGSFWLRFDSRLEDRNHRVEAERISWRRIPIYTGHGTKPNC